MQKQLILVTGHSSWWKEKKYRKQSSLKLKKVRDAGWLLLKKIKIVNDLNSIETRSFHKYYFFKK